MGSLAATGCPLASTCWRLIDHARKPLPRALPAHLSTTNTHRFPRPMWKTSAPVVSAAGRHARTPTRKHRGQFLTTAENPCHVSLAPGCPQQTPIALHARCGKPHARVDKKSPRPESLAVVGLHPLVHTKPPRLSTSGVENRTGRFLDSEEPASGRHYLLGSLHGRRPIVWGGCGWVGGTLHRSPPAPALRTRQHTVIACALSLGKCIAKKKTEALPPSFRPHPLQPRRFTAPCHRTCACTAG
jgi:hypothetical protein